MGKRSLSVLVAFVACFNSFAAEEIPLNLLENMRSNEFVFGLNLAGPIIPANPHDDEGSQQKALDSYLALYPDSWASDYERVIADDISKRIKVDRVEVHRAVDDMKVLPLTEELPYGYYAQARVFVKVAVAPEHRVYRVDSPISITEGVVAPSLNNESLVKTTTEALFGYIKQVKKWRNAEYRKYVESPKRILVYAENPSNFPYPQFWLRYVRKTYNPPKGFYGPIRFFRDLQRIPDVITFDMMYDTIRTVKYTKSDLYEWFVNK